jgi:hypothetical protein
VQAQRTHPCDLISRLVILVILAVLLENSGLLKAGPQAAEFEPVQGKTVKFSDVHGVDEAKDVGAHVLDLAVPYLTLFSATGTPRSSRVFERSYQLCDARR